MNDKLHIHLLVNETAGNGRSQKILDQTVLLLVSEDITFDIMKSTYPGEAIALAEHYGDKRHAASEVLIVIGGDGSLNEVLNGIKRSRNPLTPFAYLPAGTGNDFGRAAGLTTDPRVLLGHLKANLEPVEVDCGTFRLPGFSQNTFYFANSFGMGFDAYVNHLSNISQLKKVLNKINEGNFIYGLHILTCLRKQDTFKVEIESRGKTKIYQDAFLVTTTNHPYLGGGIPLLPVASINSHKLDTVIVEKFTLRGLIKLFVKLLRDGSHVGCPEFHYVEAEQIRVKTTKKEFAQVDGEEIKRSRFDVEFTVDQFNLLR